MEHLIGVPNHIFTCVIDLHTEPQYSVIPCDPTVN